MARIESLSLLKTDEGKEYLAEVYGEVIENIATDNLSQTLKNKNMSGDPTAGSLEAKRFANAEIDEYGTARAGGKGKNVKAKPVVVIIDDDKEIIEEVEEKDTRLYGVDGLITRRAANHKERMEKYLEKKFWEVSANEGEVFTPSAKATTSLKVLGEIITSIHKTKNEFVDGVPIDLIHVICSPDEFNEVRDNLDLLPASSITTKEREVGIYHGAYVHSSTDLSEGVKMLGYVDGATAQPVLPTVMEPSKIELSNAYGFGLFFSNGTKTVAPDLIRVWKDA